MAVDYLIDIRFPPEAEEEIRGVLYLLGSSGDVAFYDGITAFFARSEDRDEAASRLGDIEGVQVVSRYEQQKDWLALYRQSLEPLFIGTRFVVAPEPSLIPPGDRLGIVIPQERAFGTGSHESTALCLEMLEPLDLAGRTFVDVGTGSGILAIAALRLGARVAIAFDNDPEITGVVHRNVVRNDVRRLLTFVGTADAVRQLQAGAMTMNILPEVIVELLPAVVPWLGPEAPLIVSGVVLPRRDAVVAAAAAHGLRLTRELSRGEWWCGELRLPS